MSADASNPLAIRGRPISEDGAGNICLDDLWAAAGGKKSKPKLWRITEGAKALLRALAKKVGIPNHSSGTSKLIYAKRGRGSGGTFAHPVLAAAYAGYLDPDLEVEVREVWLRYRAGDATLADDILQRATAEANHWAGIRALSRSRRVGYTDTLKDHGVEAKGYMSCTEAVYLNLLGGRSFEIRRRMKLPPKANLRDHLDSDALVYVMTAEALAAERIREEGRRGNAECAEASALSAAAIRSAIEADRRSRQPRMIG